MKKVVFLLAFTFVSIFTYSQNVLIEGDGAVVLRQDNGNKISTVVFSGAVDAALNSSGTEIVITYSSGKVEIRKKNGNHVSTVEYDDARSARWSGNDIVVTYNNGSVIKRKKNGNKISTIKYSN